MEEQYINNTGPRPDNSKTGLLVGLLALLLVVGLVFAMRDASTTTPEEQQDNVTTETDVDVNDTDGNGDTDVDVYVESDLQRQARLDAETKLREIEADIQGSTATEETLEAIIATRNSLRDAYADAEGEVKESWEETDAELEKLETEVREGTATALGTLQGILTSLANFDIDVDVDADVDANTNGETDTENTETQ
jgi:hypothetical protein